MKIFLFVFVMLPGCLQAQKFNGFIVTTTDSLTKGYLRISLDEKGRKFLITTERKIKPKEYRLEDLKFYAYNKDTIAVLHNFYPFEGEDFSVDLMEADIIISRGRLKLYHGNIKGYDEHPPLLNLPTPVAYPGPNGSVTAIVQTHNYNTFILKDREGRLYGIKKSEGEFKKFMVIMIEKRQDIVALILNGTLKYKDMPTIIAMYNK